MNLLIVFSSIILCLGTRVSSEGIESDLGPTVQIENGIVKGKIIKTHNGKIVYGFLGIPFAIPPLGSLKFKRPVPYTEKFNGTYDATKLPNSCVQQTPEFFPDFTGETQWFPNTKISEDCLYLNVWVSEASFQKNSPVIFWIYGGGYYSGSSTLELYDGSTLAAEKDIVVVSTQYRIGTEGFLFLDDEEAPGNVGLLDQNLALKWTHNNIRAFGGNPDLVTLFGESCGAASVTYQMLSPMSQDLFQRAIILSGTATSSYAYNSREKSLEVAYGIAKEVGCMKNNEKDNVKEIIQCLREIPGESLHKVAWKFSKGILDFPFSPTVDNYFLPDEPKKLVKKWDTPSKDIMIGTVHDEGTYFQIYQYIKYFNRFNSSSIPYDGFVAIMKDIFKSYTPIEQNAIIFYYTNWMDLENGYKNQDLIGEAIGDAFFQCPVKEFADKWSSKKGSKTYFYFFTEHTDSDPWGNWLGVKHGDEIAYFFGQPLNPSTPFTHEERELSKKVVDLMDNFVTTGKPSPNWSPYTKSSPVFLNLNGTVISDQTESNLFGPRADKCAFWNQYLPSLRKRAQLNPHEIETHFNVDDENLCSN